MALRLSLFESARFLAKGRCGIDLAAAWRAVVSATGHEKYKHKLPAYEVGMMISAG